MHDRRAGVGFNPSSTVLDISFSQCADSSSWSTARLYCSFKSTALAPETDNARKYPNPVSLPVTVHLQ